MEKELQPHQLRVVDEQRELAIKIEALDKFIENEIYTSLPEEEQKDLVLQFMAMVDYRQVLDRRINRFYEQ